MTKSWSKKLFLQSCNALKRVPRPYIIISFRYSDACLWLLKKKNRKKCIVPLGRAANMHSTNHNLNMEPEGGEASTNACSYPWHGNSARVSKGSIGIKRNNRTLFSLGIGMADWIIPLYLSFCPFFSSSRKRCSSVWTPSWLLIFWHVSLTPSRW